MKIIKREGQNKQDKFLLLFDSKFRYFYSSDGLQSWPEVL